MKKGLMKSATAIVLLLALITILFVSEAPAVSAVDGAPRNIAVNLGGVEGNGFSFTWAAASGVQSGFVEYYPADGAKGFNGVGLLKAKASRTVTRTDRDTRSIFKVSIRDLEPDTKYVYRVGNSSDGYSAQGTLKTPATGPESYTFLNITDTQGVTSKDYAKWDNTLQKALSRFPDARFLIHTGDMVDNGDQIYQWDLFFKAAGSELINLPIMSAVGNHEAFNKNSTNPNQKNYCDAFNLPAADNTGAPTGTVYSFDYGDVHFAVMNTQCGSKNLKKQADWLRRDLAGTGRKWKIVALHRGPYGATYDTMDIRKAWVPVFDEAGVDLVLQGHDHNYSRSWPMKNGKIAGDGKGTVYLVSNTGGVKFYPLTKRSWQAVDLQPKTRMYAAVTVSAGSLKISAYDVNDVLVDSFAISKH